MAKGSDLVVISPLKDWACAKCSGTGDYLLMEDAEPLCLRCADMDHLVFLPRGDATLTRRAKKASGLAAVVVRFSRSDGNTSGRGSWSRRPRSSRLSRNAWRTRIHGAAPAA